MNPLNAVCFTVVLGVLAGCGNIDETPVIEYRGISSAELFSDNDARDDLQIFLDFTDGDGDLGGGRVRILDLRTLTLAEPLVIEQPIPAITDRNVAITGTLVVQVNDVGIIADDGETLRYEVAVFDRAGHKSNSIVTEAVTVRR